MTHYLEARNFAVHHGIPERARLHPHHHSRNANSGFSPCGMSSFVKAAKRHPKALALGLIGPPKEAGFSPCGPPSLPEAA
jgi:hypothetical protein